MELIRPPLVAEPEKLLQKRSVLQIRLLLKGLPDEENSIPVPERGNPLRRVLKGPGNSFGLL